MEDYAHHKNFINGMKNPENIDIMKQENVVNSIKINLMGGAKHPLWKVKLQKVDFLREL